MNMNDERLLSLALAAAKKAGVEVMQHYQRRDFDTQIKSDNSPVTSADIAANDIITDHLTRLIPQIPIISEEVGALPLQQRRDWTRYWLLDPIDGTGEFIIGSGDFAVNIALIENGRPTIGVIHAPAHGMTYYGQKNLGAFKENHQSSMPIRVAEYHAERPIKVAISRRQERSLMGQYLNDDYGYDFVSLGSCSLKNALIAEGGADCYLRVGPTGEWDTGASQCILEQAGGSILDSQFNPLSYNCRERLTNPDFVSLGHNKFPWQKIIKPHTTQREY